MRRILIYYNFILVTILTLWGFFNATSQSQIIISLFAYPLFVYFAMQVIPRRQKSFKAVQAKIVHTKLEEVEGKPGEEVVLTIEEEPKRGKLDVDRRMFLKLIGSAGLSLFLFSIFTKRAEAAFFGSVPGPGTVAIKDSTGALIDPAEKQPTDGYRITDLDDSSPGYYGFVNKTGAWYIMQEASSGAYRYVKGASGYSTAWTNRASQTYDYFDNTF